MEDVQSLRVFQAVAQNLSFTRAAEGLFLTQSAVSHQIARLERELGTPLFERLGRRVELTAAGQALQRHCARVFAVLEEARLAVKQAARPDAGSLRIGASATACQFIIPEALREFRECFPAWSLSITPGDSFEVAQKLIDGALDVALMIRPERGPKLDYHPLFEDDMGLVINSAHRLATATRIGRDELANEKFVLYTRGSASWRLIERQFARIQLPLQDAIELGSVEAIKELVKLGLGVTVLAPWVCREETEAGSLVWRPIRGIRLRRRWCISTAPGRRLSIAEQTFVNLCKSAAESIAGPPARVVAPSSGLTRTPRSS